MFTSLIESVRVRRGVMKVRRSMELEGVIESYLDRYRTTSVVREGVLLGSIYGYMQVESRFGRPGSGSHGDFESPIEEEVVEVDEELHPVVFEYPEEETFAYLAMEAMIADIDREFRVLLLAAIEEAVHEKVEYVGHVFSWYTRDCDPENSVLVWEPFFRSDSSVYSFPVELQLAEDLDVRHIEFSEPQYWVIGSKSRRLMCVVVDTNFIDGQRVVALHDPMVRTQPSLVLSSLAKWNDFKRSSVSQIDGPARSL